ncbi:MAG: discoidin domain-containing protein [Actinomycetaceae bacterium]|nr:discoidin domain-containing protein [Actinomycetaceae bacterium]
MLLAAFFLISFVNPMAFAAEAQNVARGKTAVADSQETTNFNAAKAVDGDTSSKASRWASAADATGDRDGGPHWIYVDLEQSRTISTVRLYWEQRKAKGYKIQVAAGDTAPAADSDQWVTVYSQEGHPSALNETLTIDNPQEGRFVRLYIDANTFADPDGGVAWGTVSLFEIELFEGAPALSMDEVANAISVTQPALGDDTLQYEAPSSEEYEITYNGTDYEQVIDSELGIHTPLVETEVQVSFKVTNKANPTDYVFKELPVLVPGEFEKAEGDNAAPVVVPELRQWKGGAGEFVPTGRVVYSDASLERVASELASDYTDLFGSKIVTVAGAEAGVGDILLTLNGAAALGEEGYDLSVTDKVVVDATTATGAYWGTRTILQALKSGDSKIPQGTARDYPLYEVRGFMLDVGRKTFTLDYLKQVVKQMAWYKLNDFHVHLNDNYIWVEEYTDDTVDQAYSGFRLESDIKEGGNGGLNKADLTNTDVWYSKADFRSFIKDSRALGVNIVPEFDMPAHSLAFTKVRPDLRTPKNLTHRGNDHLDLANKYSESFDFATDVWDEYLTGGDPVFDQQTTVHIGADEFEADGNAYRTFVNDLFGHVENTGRTARVWGSLTHIKGDVQVSGVAENGERRQMNLWSTGWAHMKPMYDLGFGLINTQDGAFYIVPNATYYGDYLDPARIYNHEMNSYGGHRIPAGDPQMYGATFAVWNDMIGKRDNGMSEFDIYDRFNTIMGAFGAATWGKGANDAATVQANVRALGDAPATNFAYDVATNDEGEIAHYIWNDASDVAGMQADAALSEGAELAEVDGKSVLSLSTASSYASTGIGTVGLGNNLRVKVKRMSDAEEQVLFESDYGQIKAVQKGTGNVGISRENRDYSFNYKLPVGEWVELEFKNEQNFTTLYVDGELIQKIGVEGRGKLKATSMFPVERIGSKQNGFVGFIDDVRLGTDKEFASTMKLDRLMITARGVLAQNQDDDLAALIDNGQKIIDMFDPAAADIDTAVAALTEYLSNAEYEVADYSRVDALIAAIPSDLSRYTDKSVDQLRAVIEQIEANRGLPKELQSNVDAFEQSLLNARAALVEKDADALVVDNLTASASSEETNQESSPASAAVDGDPGTFWHTKWSNGAAPGPHWIDLELPTPQEVTGITYMPRGDGNINGALMEYRVDVKTADGDYETVAQGNVDTVNTTQRIVFDTPVKNATNVRLHYVQSKGDFATAGEIKVHATLPAASEQDLAQLVSEAEALDPDLYTPETWAAVSAALGAAKDNPGDIDAAANNLRSALLALTAKQPDPSEPSEPVDPSEPSGPSTPTDPTNPTDPTDPTDPSEPSNPSEPTSKPTDTSTTSTTQSPTTPQNSGHQNLAKTGVEIAALAILGLALGALGFSAITLRRRRG